MESWFRARTAEVAAITVVVATAVVVAVVHKCVAILVR
jgi:hypothetical protein